MYEQKNPVNCATLYAFQLFELWNFTIISTDDFAWTSPGRKSNLATGRSWRGGCWRGGRRGEVVRRGEALLRRRATGRGAAATEGDGARRCCDGGRRVEVRNDGGSRNGARERGRQGRGAPAVEGDGGSTTTTKADRRRQGRRIDGGRGEVDDGGREELARDFWPCGERRPHTTKSWNAYPRRFGVNASGNFKPLTGGPMCGFHRRKRPIRRRYNFFPSQLAIQH
jgi:hypothetical protein